MNLWPHQQRALDDIEQSILSGYKNICVTAPTGAGKTRIMLELIKRQNQSALYTHRRSLLAQTADDLVSNGFEFGFRAAGEEPALLRDTQLCMIQSEYSAVSKGRRNVHPAKQVLVDEAHNNAANSAMELFQLHAEHDAVRIGLTATPTSLGHAYEKLIIAATNSELRKCGAHVPAIHFSPDEPDTKLIGKVQIDGSECGINQKNRTRYCQRVFGSVIDNYTRINPQRRPAILFAPGVSESKWFCDQLNRAGIIAAHIDGENCILHGETITTDEDVRTEIKEQLKAGHIHVVCNRFVLREGVDWPFLYHCIFATVFGGITSYLQSGGRLLRNSGDWDNVVVQDHGGNALRHGSLNEDREWELGLSDNQIYQIRREKIREKQEPEPIVCPKCGAMRLSGPICHQCDYRHVPDGRRPVLQTDGTLKMQKVAEWMPKRYLPESDQIRKQWESRVRSVQRSKKDTVKTMTFAQLHANMARDNYWKYPPKTLPLMPIKAADWYRPIQSVPASQLRQSVGQSVLF